MIYLRRPSERANNPFTNRFFFPLVSTSFIILLQIILYAFFYLVTYSQASISVLSIMLSIMIADVIYIILDTVANRSFRHILKASLHYFFVSMLVVLVIAPVNLTKGFGFVTNVPTGIDYVEVIYDDNLSLMLSYSKSDQYFYHDSYQMTMKFTEDDDIALITSLHQLIIDNYYDFDYNANNFNANYANIEDEYHLNTFDGLDYSGTTYISFTYHLQNGLIVSRNYNVNYNWLASLMTLYQKPTVEQYRIPLALYYDQADSIDSIQLIDKLKLTGTDVNADFNLDAFTEAYRLDYQNLPADGLLSTDYVYYGRLSANLCKYQSKESTYCTTDYLDIDSRFTRTLAYLNSIGMTFPESDYNVKARIIFPETDEAFYGFQIANPDYYSYSTEQLYNYTELSSEQLQAVIPYLLPYGLTAEPTLLFCVSSDNSSSTFLIDPQHEDEVRTLLTDNIIKQNNDIYNIIYGYELNED
ncbi:hypothetical protein SDC9_97885 [bioreactor metagenome]|uniref:Uncharacterized protein n=1 Tax=bioreactor metagenome TaxID=1076179 RepID=A0A645AEK0_9ZZZZ